MNQIFISCTLHSTAPGAAPEEYTKFILMQAHFNLSKHFRQNKSLT